MLTRFAILDLGVPEVFIVIILLAVLTFEIFMILSALQNKRLSDSTRALWIIGMLLVHPFVAVAYYFTDYKKDT
jgi:hypothetical protein